MKARTLFINTLVLFAITLMPTACLDEITKEITPSEDQVTVIPYTVTVQNAPETRVTLSWGGQYLFEEGDKLVISKVNGSYKKIEGELLLVSGSASSSATFKGNLYCTGYSGEPPYDEKLKARLISAKNLLVDNDYSNAISESVEKAIQEYSLFEAESTYGEKNFDLQQKSAFVEFTVKFNPAPESSGPYLVRIINKANTTLGQPRDTLAEGSTTLKNGTAKFVATFPGETKLEHAFVQLNDKLYRWGGEEATLSGNTLSSVSKTIDATIFPSDLATPLSFEATAIDGDNMPSYMTIHNPLRLTIQYSINGDGIVSKDDEYISVTFFKGETIRLYGDNETYAISDTDYGWPNNDQYTHIRCLRCYVYGNVMSLISSSSFSTRTELTSNYTFYSLFAQSYNGDNALYNHPEKNLILPATKLTKGCYAFMFRYCHQLSRPPIIAATELQERSCSYMFDGAGIEKMPLLSATKMASRCYEYMFMGCKNLTQVYALPATELAEGCYYSMFSGCTSLETVPKTMLPAQQVSSSCYDEMFRGCSSLTSPPDLPATDLESNYASYCYAWMFEGCTSLERAPALPATILSSGCYMAMFKNCTSFMVAPDLPAATIRYNSYSNMFEGCSKIDYLKCSATSWFNEDPMKDWLKGVSPTGTFVKAPGVNWPEGDSGIPTEWTVVEVQ